jgi:hypothetical protein
MRKPKPTIGPLPRSGNCEAVRIVVGVSASSRRSSPSLAAQPRRSVLLSKQVCRGRGYVHDSPHRCRSSAGPRRGAPREMCCQLRQHTHRSPFSPDKTYRPIVAAPPLRGKTRTGPRARLGRANRRCLGNRDLRREQPRTNNQQPTTSHPSDMMPLRIVPARIVPARIAQVDDAHRPANRPHANAA